MASTQKCGASDRRPRWQLAAVLAVLVLSMGWIALYLTGGASAEPRRDPTTVQKAMDEAEAERVRIQQQAITRPGVTKSPSGA